MTDWIYYINLTFETNIPCNNISKVSPRWPVAFIGFSDVGDFKLMTSLKRWWQNLGLCDIFWIYREFFIIFAPATYVKDEVVTNIRHLRQRSSDKEQYVLENRIIKPWNALKTRNILRTSILMSTIGWLTPEYKFL